MVKIQGAALNSPQLQINLNNSSVISTLRGLVGQTINLQVVQAQPQQAEVRIAGQVVTAQTNLALTPGQQLQAKVGENQGQIRLNILPQAQTADVSKAFYRQLLPHNVSLQQTLNFLQQPQVLSQLPTVVQGQLSLLLDQLLRPQLLDAQRLKQALNQGGSFFENKVKQQQAGLQQDIKAQLFKMQQQLANINSNQRSPSLAQALSLVHQSINKISLNQLNQLNQDTAALANLAIANHQYVDQLQLEIRKNQIQGAQVWEVIFNLSIENQDITCKLNWHSQQMEFNCWFFVADSTLSHAFSQQLPALREMFIQAGLALNLLELTANKPQFSANAKQLGLIDIKI